MVFHEQSKPLLRRAGEGLRRWVGPKAFFVLNSYLPYLVAGIAVREIASDGTRFDVELRLRPWNKNYYGTHFGGSLYAMCDPFYALILTEWLGSSYVVWDKAATIRFKRPGRGVVRARFEISHEQLEEIRNVVNREGKGQFLFETRVLGEQQETVAEVEKVVSVHRTRDSSASG
ncbi:MAG: DUF4442 domain-containing protein [Polyangiaceae bacterium]|jgi:acyl-coenzyme A thioesterase PaaI-like protein|nr:DUF4442 domain-containing protein [Polyangiaceae bacterium]